MMNKAYQRKYLRAPFKETILYADGPYVLKGSTINISEGGILLNQLPSFPEKDEVDLLISLPQLPFLKNFTILKMQTFTKELFPRQVIRARAQLVRREELSQDLDNIFRSRFGLEFVQLEAKNQKRIDDYVTTFASNLIYLQTLIDSFNTDDETKVRTRELAAILGYRDIEKIASLRSQVGHDYRSLQWL